MKRIAAIADSHFTLRSRWDECLRLHDVFASEVEARRPDLVLHAGDVYDAKSTPDERNAVVAWARRVAGVAPMVIVRGNHDVVGDLDVLGKLDSKYPIHVIERSDVIEVAGVSVFGLAWPRSAELLAAAGHPISVENAATLAADCLRAVFLGCAAAWRANDKPKIVLAHASVRGSMTSLGQPLVGADMEIGTDDLLLTEADLIVLGHIHKGQSWPGTPPIVYPGSPRRTAYGELETKAWLNIEVGPDRSVRIESVPLPAQTMLLIEDEWTPAGWLRQAEALASSDMAGADVRLRYTVETDQREVADVRAGEYRSALIDRGAAIVRIEETVRASVRARAPEVAMARTIGDKLRAVWVARGVKPEDDRADRIVRLATELEAEAIA